MTVYSGSDLPKRAAVDQEHRGPDTRRRILKRRTVCLWILLAFLPFLVLRLVVFYAPPFPYFAPPVPARKAEVQIPSPDVCRCSQRETALPPDSKSATNTSNPSPVLLPTRKSEAPIVAVPLGEELNVDPDAAKLVHISPEASRLAGEEPSSNEKLEEEENRGSPDDNKTKDEEKWQAPPEEKQLDDKQGIEQFTSGNASASSPAATEECDLYDGDWVRDWEGPLYTNATCSYIQSQQNCMKNGRPDTGYLYWKWKPRQCDLARFDSKAFLQKFWGKAIGFVGDSLARNQMQSLLCLLSQVEIPDLIYQDNDQKNVRWRFKNHQLTVGMVWSPYLVKETTAEFKDIEEGQSKMFTDILSEEWTSVMNDFDVMVFSMGHWYLHPCVYIENDQIIGCHYCPGRNLTEIGFYQAYRKAFRHVLDKVTTDYKGFAVVSTFPMGHFENGSWDNGGHCRREQPLTKEEKVLKGMSYEMHQIVVDEYTSTVQRSKTNNENVQVGLLDITSLCLLRADGHPGPYREYHPFEGKPPGTQFQNDCLHWCLPGPIDTWNQFLVEVVSSGLKI